MKIFVFDFETNGLADFNKRASDPSQPHIVELSAGLYNEAGALLEDYTAIAKPDGWIITQELAEIHGITNQMALNCGIPEKELAEYAIKNIQAADLIVSYNLMFDKYIARIAGRRFKIFTDADDIEWKKKRGCCVMKSCTNIIGGKYPKLREAYYYFFKRPLPDAHAALGDRTAAAELFFHLLRHKLISL